MNKLLFFLMILWVDWGRLCIFPLGPSFSSLGCCCWNHLKGAHSGRTTHLTDHGCWTVAGVSSEAQIKESPHGCFIWLQCLTEWDFSTSDISRGRNRNCQSRQSYNQTLQSINILLVKEVTGTTEWSRWERNRHHMCRRPRKMRNVLAVASKKYSLQ